VVDIFDIMAFVVFAVLIAAGFVIVVGLGMLPGRIARQRGHPQATAINVASWLGLATGGVLWLVAMIWAFAKPVAAPAPSQQSTTPPPIDGESQLAQLRSRIAALEASLGELRGRKERGP
jgi:hypothetical protein